MPTTRRFPGVRPRRWTKEEYYRLGELGFFRRQRLIGNPAHGGEHIIELY